MMRALTLLAAGTAASASLVVLTPDNFDQHVGGSNPALVKFYAPWCGHCKSMAPAYEEAAEAFTGAPVVVGKFDADEHKEFGNKFGVRGYPTIKWFPAGSKEGEDYDGGRTAEELVSWINEKTGQKKAIKKAPSAVVELTPSNFDAVVGDNSKLRLVEFFAPWCGHCKALAPTWQKLASAFEGEESKVVIAAVDADKHRALGERFGVKGFPTIKAFLPGKDEPEDYQGSRDLADFISFINGKAGTARDASGNLQASAGRLEAFDDFAEEFVKAAEGAARAAVQAKAAAAAAELKGQADHAAADSYVKVMGKVAEKGLDYVAKEKARLEGMIASDSIAKSKKLSFMAKRNVLNAFAEAMEA